MKLEAKIKNIKNKVSGKLLFNESLSKFSWFNLGGPASIIFKPNTLDELSNFLKIFQKALPIKVLGIGSNVLIRDGGFKGVIIKLGKAFSRISLLNENSLIAGASSLDKNVSKFALNNWISGFEFLSCIPGTIGGAIRMNSGCYGEDISNILLSVQAMDQDGNIILIPSSNLDNDLIFLSSTFSGLKKDKKIIEQKMNRLISQKKVTQPSNIKTCGSTFKNPETGLKKKAWQLIKLANCDKFKIGDAGISHKHCNFFVNNGSAKAKDLENLILTVKRKVFEKTGINLELELQIIGDKV